jgi:hypothetical protein
MAGALGWGFPGPNASVAVDPSWLWSLGILGVLSCLSLRLLLSSWSPLSESPIPVAPQ